MSLIALKIKIVKFEINNKSKRILQNLIDCKSYKEKADSLIVSFDMVSNYIKEFYTTLGVKIKAVAMRKFKNSLLI